MDKNICRSRYYKKLWNTDFIEIEGMIFLSSKWVSAKDNFYLLKKRLNNPQNIEKEINHVHLDVEDNDNPIDYSSQMKFANALKARWQQKLNEKYPDKEFMLEIEEIPPHQVTVYLCTKRPAEAST